MSETFNEFKSETDRLETEERIGPGEQLTVKPEAAKAETPRLDAEKLSVEAKQTAESTNSAAEVLKNLEHEAKDDQTPPSVIGKMQREISYQHSITQVRRNENKANRTLSHVIHQPTVKVLSDVGAKSIMRPSGILGGSLLAFVGTAAYLLASNVYHFPYNYTMSLVLFVGGFLLGIILELVVNLLSKRQLD